MVCETWPARCRNLLSAGAPRAGVAVCKDQLPPGNGDRPAAQPGCPMGMVVLRVRASSAARRRDVRSVWCWPAQRNPAAATAGFFLVGHVRASYLLPAHASLFQAKDVEPAAATPAGPAHCRPSLHAKRGCIAGPPDRAADHHSSRIRFLLPAGQRRLAPAAAASSPGARVWALDAPHAPWRLLLPLALNKAPVGIHEDESPSAEVDRLELAGGDQLVRHGTL